MKEKEQIHIPKTAKHRMANLTNNIVVFIEIQMGTYFGEDDIILGDDYQRRSED